MIDLLIAYTVGRSRDRSFHPQHLPTPREEPIEETIPDRDPRTIAEASRKVRGIVLWQDAE